MKKRWLWVIGLALVVPIVALCGCSPGVTRWANMPSSMPSPLQVSLDGQQAGIWVTGQGKVMATPDIAILRLGIEVQEATVAEAQAEAAEAMDRVMTALKDNEVDEKDIQTQYFNIRKVTRWDDYKDQEIVIGYRVTNMVSAKIRDIDNAGATIDAVAAVAGDLTRIDSIGFSIDDPSAYYEEAREKAIADAEAKAEQLASLAGVNLGKPTYISEGISYPPPLYRQGVHYEATAPIPAPALPTSISPGEMEISLSVQVAYAILN